MYNLDHLVPVPSLFFIGRNGVPLEIVAGEVNVPELLHRITIVLEKDGKTVSSGKINCLLTANVKSNLIALQIGSKGYRLICIKFCIEYTVFLVNILYVP
jgi:hypothetical protein